MNILFVSHLFPWPLDQGTRQRVYYLLRGLTRDHAVTLLAFGDAETPNSLEIDGDLRRTILVNIGSRNNWKSASELHWEPITQQLRGLLGRVPASIAAWRSEELVRVLRQLNQDGKFDAVWVERSFMAEMVAEAGFRNVIVDVDECESGSMARTVAQQGWYASKPLHLAQLAKLRHYERRLGRRFSRLVLCKEDDRRQLGAAPNVSVIPNGAVMYAPPDRSREVSRSLLFVGSLDYGPNIHGAEWMCANVMPRLRSIDGLRMTIAGRNPVPEVSALDDGQNCIVIPNVPDLASLYAEAAVVVSPIFLGGGTRLKVLEALSRGKALVATGIAVEGLNLVPNLHYLRADDDIEFAQACQELLNDPARRKQLGSAAQEVIQTRFSWDRIGRMASELASGVLRVE